MDYETKYKRLSLMNMIRRNDTLTYSSTVKNIGKCPWCSFTCFKPVTVKFEKTFDDGFYLLHHVQTKHGLIHPFPEIKLLDTAKYIERANKMMDLVCAVLRGQNFGPVNPIEFTVFLDSDKNCSDRIVTKDFTDPNDDTSLIQYAPFVTKNMRVQELEDESFFTVDTLNSRYDFESRKNSLLNPEDDKETKRLERSNKDDDDEPGRYFLEQSAKEEDDEPPKQLERLNPDDDKEPKRLERSDNNDKKRKLDVYLDDDNSENYCGSCYTILPPLYRLFGYCHWGCQADHEFELRREFKW